MTTQIFPIEINLKETKNLSRSANPCRLGIPFPCGAIHQLSELQLIDENNNAIPIQVQSTASWHDQSIRWALVDFHASIRANKQITYSLIKKSDKIEQQYKDSISIKEENNLLIINTGKAEFQIDKTNFLPFKKISINGQALDIKPTEIELKDSNNTSYQAVIDHIDIPNKQETLRSTLTIKGHFKSPNNNASFLKFESSLTFFANSALCEIEFTLHNPNAAKHPGGFWDMGDPGSQYFKSLAININLQNTPKVEWKNNSDTQWSHLEGSDIRLYQDSSGGKNWNHHIHIDKDNQSTVSFKGYQIASGNKVIDQGNRASPIFSIKDKNHTQIKAYVKKFWQNFPKAISVQNNQLNIEIFPNTPKSDYELQGGEQKTHNIILDFENNSDTLEQYITPLKATLPLKHYTSSDAMPWLPEEYKPTDLDRLINEGLEGDRNFFWKREKADEYGWRNFGELWADHETLEHGNDESLVSHYNNQYDPIYGFARQYILTGDQRWFKLMEDLAKHVIDIDIYHTDKDRPEYNNGLFWHTDHYLDGRHCTHRTFSKSHLEIDHIEQSGGGPGSEHCYSKGLKYYYWLTGNTSAKHTTMALSKWARYPNEGGDTVIERLFNFVKHDLKKMKRIKNGDYLFNYQFPLNRGTGNYLSSLLDAYNLEPNKEILQKASDVIKRTISAKDEIKHRYLMTDIESFWHYTIFLQSILTFIKIKESENKLDEDYQYALQSFCHYSQWIVKNEKPYLENSDILVYPNDTWVAQDFRKLNLLKNYIKYSSKEKQQEIQNKIEYFEQYVSQYFEKNTNETTRILAIMMQNQINKFNPVSKKSSLKTANQLKIVDKRLSIAKVLTKFISELTIRLFKLNPKNEYRWIKSRTKK